MADELHIHDIIIIGAGPSGLALAARLRESTPSALFTDSEHQRYHWMRHSQTSKPPKSHRFSRRSHTAADRLLRGPSLSSHHALDIAVLDAHSDSWMGSWNQRFRDLGIGHLRSPMFFHPDPGDRDGLLSFAYREGREKELREIKDVVGKGLSKHQRKAKAKNSGKRQQGVSYLDERERNDYFRPSQKLFGDYCEDVVERYDLAELVEKSEVSSISYAKAEGDEPGVFTLETTTGRRKARIVVFAVGGGLKPTLPRDCPFKGLEHGSVAHAFTPPVSSKAKHNLPLQVLQKIALKKSTTLIVVGGGLTSAQVADSAIRAGVTKVYLLARSRLKVKHFDVDLCWVGKYKNFHMSTFWSADDDEERFEMVRDARGGGSVTPGYRKILAEHERKGRVQICEKTRIVGATWDEERRTWELRTEPAIEGLEKVDHIVYATGLQPDFRGIVAVKPLLEWQDVRCVGGMPCLTDDLMFDEEIPFFVTGRLASLRLGPGAGNLEGARIGAERVAWKVGELLKVWDRTTDVGDSGYGSTGSEGDGDVDGRRLGLGMQNQFGVLEMSDDIS